MARIRTIKPEFWRHPVLGRLPDDQQLLAISLLSMSDDEGYFRAVPDLIRGDVQPFRDDLAKISRGIEKLSEIGFVDIVEHSEQGAIGKIKNWEKHQKVDHPNPSKLKAYYLFAKGSRGSLENLAPEQGTGNIDQGTDKKDSFPKNSGTPDSASLVLRQKPGQTLGNETPPVQPGTPKPGTPKPPHKVTLPSGLDKSTGLKKLSELKQGLKRILDPHSYDTWIVPLGPVAVENRTLYVSTPTEHFRWVEEKYKETMLPLIAELGLQGIVFVVREAIA